MAAIDLDALLAAIDELAARNGSSRIGFLLDHGLSIHDRPGRWTYRSTPMNSLTFASTGGDGVHFGLICSAAAAARDGAVVMTVPMAQRPNHVVAGSLGEFLGLGCVHGWFSLEQLAYRPAYSFELYGHAAPPTEAPIRQLFEKLSLTPLALRPARLEELARWHGESIVTARSATDFDREFLRALHHAAFRDVVIRQFGSWVEADQDRWFEASLTKGEFSIVEVSGSPVGAIAVAETEQSVTVVEMQILPAWQNRGIGSALLADVVERARKRHKPVDLQVLRENRARQLYERKGFGVTGETETHYLMLLTPPREGKDIPAGSW